MSNIRQNSLCVSFWRDASVKGQVSLKRKCSTSTAHSLSPGERSSLAYSFQPVRRWQSTGKKGHPTTRTSPCGCPEVGGREAVPGRLTFLLTVSYNSYMQ